MNAIRSQSPSSKRPAVAAQIVDGELRWGKVERRHDYVDNIDIAVQRLFCDETVWVVQLVSVVNCVQRTVTMTLESKTRE